MSDIAAANLGAVGHLHGPAVGREHSGPGDRRDLAALEQRFESRREAIDHCLLAGLRFGEVHGRCRGVHSEFGGAPHRAEDLGRLQELLGRNAPTVQARAADAALLDHRDVHPGRRPVERGRVATGPTAENHEVEIVGQGHLGSRMAKDGGGGVSVHPG